MKSSTPTSGIHLWLLLFKASRSVEETARRSVQGSGLCLSDFGVLEALLHKGPLPVGAIQRKILLTSGSTTAAVDRLERQGWVVRVAKPGDRRARIVRLTPTGKARITRLFTAHAREMEAVFMALNGAERTTLERLLRKLGTQPTKEKSQ